MRLFASLAIGVVALAAPALAALPAPKLFLSPSGEPFRASPASPDPIKAWFDQADTKRQGYLDREEFRADAVRFFKRLDTNGDGVVDGFEVADYEHKLVPELAAEAEGPSPPPAGSDRSGGREGPGGSGHDRGHQDQAQPGGAEHGRGPPQRRILQLIGEPEPVSGADFNFDTHITLEEWLRAADQRFEILDEHKDGKLTLEELRARLLPQGKAR